MANNQQLLLGEGAGSAPVVYVEEVFSTYLYTANNTVITITNGIDLATKGGLVWQKARNGAGYIHCLFDTARGVGNILHTDNTAASDAQSNNAALSTGFTTGRCGGYVNSDSLTYCSWTFREQPKFFDVVTYTGTGSNRTIAHTLGSVPGCIIVKRTDTTAAWAVYHRSLANTEYLVLNTTAAKATGATWWNSTTPTSTVFSVGTDASVNASGGTYVAYIYAHDAGGFGLAGTDNVISCGTFTNNTTVTLGYEPQFVMVKRTDNSGNWLLLDQMRGIATDGNDALLFANSSDAEDTANNFLNLTATGFSTLFGNGTFIYIAIRRGPMKVPTVGTSVYKPIARTSTGSATAVTGVGFTPDASLIKRRDNTANNVFVDRLRGRNLLRADNTGAEIAASSAGRDLDSFDMDGISIGTNWNVDLNAGGGATYIDHFFRRAPGFFDEVCYTGTGSNLTLNHNLSVAPELIITKRRNGATYGAVYASSRGVNKFLELFSSSGSSAEQTFSGSWLTPTSTTFGIGATDQNNSGDTYVAYLFATCAGVSKVGSYTGNGSSQTIACGFAAGSRFVMIKRTDSTGDWYVWDSARGIVAGNDPHLSLNSTAAEVTTDDSVDTDNSGFIVNQVAATNVNVTSATYIFLAIA